MYKISIISVFVLLVSCTSYEDRVQFEAEFSRTIPECHSGKECELMWSRARSWVLDNAGMKLQHITDDFLETYNPVGSSALLAVRVVKEPIGQSGSYRLVATAWCNNFLGCVPEVSDAMLDFNASVSGVGVSSY